jgi:hypothetical protein
MERLGLGFVIRLSMILPDRLRSIIATLTDLSR